MRKDGALMRRLGLIIMSLVAFFLHADKPIQRVADTKEIHHTDHLVIICIDFRIQEHVHAWVKAKLGSADFIAAAGAARFFEDEASRRFLLEQVRLAVDLHGITNLHLVDHLDCGAYGGSSAFASVEREIAAHQERLRSAAAIIRRSFPRVRVRLYILRKKHPQLVDG